MTTLEQQRRGHRSLVFHSGQGQVLPAPSAGDDGQAHWIEVLVKKAGSGWGTSQCPSTSRLHRQGTRGGMYA